MTYSKAITPQSNILLIFIISFGLLANACGDNPTDNDDSESDTTEEQVVEGSMDNYDLGEQELYKKEDFVDLIEGTINTDGSFTITFLGIDDIEDALKPLGDESSDNFVGMYCREEIAGSLDSENLFVDVNVFNFTYGEDNNFGTMGLSSGEPNLNIYPPQSDDKGAFQVRWIFSNEAVTINQECSVGAGGTEIVDLELEAGWNEVIFDLSDSEDKRQFTGARPAEAGWVLNQ